MYLIVVKTIIFIENVIFFVSSPWAFDIFWPSNGRLYEAQRTSDAHWDRTSSNYVCTSVFMHACMLVFKVQLFKTLSRIIDFFGGVVMPKIKLVKNSTTFAL